MLRRAIPITAVLAVLLGAGFVGAGRFLEVNDPLPARADAIVILAGSLADRTLEAADLYHAGLAPRVVVTKELMRSGELDLRARGVVLPESHDLTQSALAQLGVPNEAILVLRRRGDSTENEARTIARWACRERLAHLVVVTSKAHSRRARLILRETLGPDVALTLRATRYDPFSGSRWWQNRRDAKYVWWEYEKLTHYWLREHWEAEPCGGLIRQPGPS